MFRHLFKALRQEVPMSPALRAAHPAAHSPLPLRALPLELVALIREPLRAFPAVFERRSALALLGFPAMSGVYVAYVLAAGIGLGDRFGVAAVAAGVATGGAALGMIALWFAGSITSWSVPDSDDVDEDYEHMFLVFSYATWPFLPLLAIIVPAEVLLYGDSIFSLTRRAAPAAAQWGLRAVELTAILLWLVMMLKGTALVRHESARTAARELVRWGAELFAIAVLFALIMMASMMYW
jgi:hypothetical protein